MGIRNVKIGGRDIPVMEQTGDRYREQFYSRRGTYNRGYVGRDYLRSPVGSSQFAVSYPSRRIIPTDSWRDIIARIGKENSLFDVQQQTGTPTLSQAHTKYCWGAACTGVTHTKRAQNNRKHVVDLSNASVCAPIKNYRNVGGFCLEWIKYAATQGIAEAEDWPGNAIDKRYAREASQNRKRHRPEKWLDLPYKEPKAVASELLRQNPTAIEIPWWGHAVEAVQLVDLSFMNESWPGMLIRNSHGEVFGWKGYVVLTYRLWKEIQGGATLLAISDAEASQ